MKKNYKTPSKWTSMGFDVLKINEVIYLVLHLQVSEFGDHVRYNSLVS